jgi:hypothetical protein
MTRRQRKRIVSKVARKHAPSPRAVLPWEELLSSSEDEWSDADFLGKSQVSTSSGRVSPDQAEEPKLFKAGAAKLESSITSEVG